MFEFNRRAVEERAATAISALGYSGICYESRHGIDLRNWALFEPFQLQLSESLEISIADADLMEAADRLELSIDPEL
jgi:hypothetical protein